MPGPVPDSSVRTSQVASIAITNIKKARDDSGVPKPNSIAAAIQARLTAQGFIIKR
jgi:hypothetical protein